MNIEENKAMFVLGETYFHLDNGIVLVDKDSSISEGDWIGYPLNDWTPVQYCGGDLIGNEFKVIAASFELEGLPLLILEPIDNVFPCTITATGQKGWKFFYTDKNDLNQHSRFFVSENECRIEAKKHLFPDAIFTKLDLARFFEIVSAEAGDYLDGVVDEHSFGSCLIKLMKESKTNLLKTLELDVENGNLKTEDDKIVINI